MTDAARMLDALEARPLVGRHRAELRRGLAEVAAATTHAPDAGDTARLLGLGARLARAEGARDALQRLNRARRAASDAGDIQLEDRLALLTVRTLARSRATHRATDLLTDILARVQRTPELEAEVALACAAVGLGAPREHLEAALARLPSPVADHDRMEAALDLAELLLSGAAPGAAAHWFEHARALALEHDAPVELGVASSSLAVLALEAGNTDQAATLLDEALEASEALDDDLGRIAHGSVRAALHLAQGDIPSAAQLARRTEAAARRRSNWIGVADAVITQTLAEPLERAVERLAIMASTLQAQGSQAAANLLKARLAELRTLHPEGEFEAALAAAAKRL